MTIWFTSDEHYDHKNIIKYANRPFRDVPHMREEMIARNNSVVGKDDIVWHLGDFSFQVKTVKEILPRLNGEHHLIAGNHDLCHPYNRHKKRYVSYEVYRELGFTSVVLETIINDFEATHLPYTADQRHGERYADYRPHDDGETWLLHGHIHGLWKVNGRQINVGVDVWDYKPVSLEQLLEIKNASD